MIQAKMDPATDLTKLGTFGDSFGALNTLFSGLAFAAIVVSIYIQSKELEATREDVHAQKIQQIKQSFESSFFQLLQFNTQIINNFSYLSPFTQANIINVVPVVGLKCFEKMREDFSSVCLNSDHWGTSSEERYNKFYSKFAHDQLGHYFRNLYQIVKLVDTSNIDDKKFYSNIIRAQLSTHELYLLFYNGLSDFGHDKFFPLLQRYAFFEHLPTADDILQIDANKYGIQAFGTSPEWKNRFQSSKA